MYKDLLFLCMLSTVAAFSAVLPNLAATRGIKVDLIQPAGLTPGQAPCTMNEVEDFGSILLKHKKAVLFAVPGAFTPTCSAQHLPGFIKKMGDLKAKGVEAVYCLSVNDKHVMRCWAESIEGCRESGIYLVADGNGEFTQKLGMVKDATGSRMGLRSMRYAMLIENGLFTSVNVDEKGLEKSSAENILSQLG